MPQSIGRLMERLTSMLLGAEIKRSREVGVADDDILLNLRLRGYSKLESVSAFADAGLPLMEAKRLVHESTAWHDAKWRDDHIFDDPDQIESDA
jgi:hypothetical protein